MSAGEGQDVGLEITHDRFVLKLEGNPILAFILTENPTGLPSMAISMPVEEGAPEEVMWATRMVDFTGTVALELWISMARQVLAKLLPEEEVAKAEEFIEDFRQETNLGSRNQPMNRQRRRAEQRKAKKHGQA